MFFGIFDLITMFDEVEVLERGHNTHYYEEWLVIRYKGRVFRIVLDEDGDWVYELVNDEWVRMEK